MEHETHNPTIRVNVIAMLRVNASQTFSRDATQRPTYRILTTRSDCMTMIRTSTDGAVSGMGFPRFGSASILPKGYLQWPEQLETQWANNVQRDMHPDQIACIEAGGQTWPLPEARERCHRRRLPSTFGSLNKSLIWWEQQITTGEKLPTASLIASGLPKQPALCQHDITWSW